ncbi:BglG family transcription antiterminator [Pantoea piersonii]|uniref:BglG family transcription antiterminator n=1 Tax=Pantoea piersonii TaxID=2364647 RepID=UPI0028A2046E|nr:PRD domain-containing protein [Pantoea piersonii]
MQILTSRQHRLMKLLLHQAAPQPIGQLALQLGVSGKTIQRDLQGLESWLSNWALTLEKSPGRGVRLRVDDIQQRLQLEQQLNGGDAAADALSHNSRRVKIASQLLSEAPRATSISKLSERYFISHASIVNDLKVIEEWLQPLGLTLQRGPGGTHIEGNEQTLRQAMVSLINDVMQQNVAGAPLLPRLDPGSQQALVHYFGEEDVAFVQALLLQMEQQLNYPLGDAWYLNLCTHILIMMHRMAQGNALALEALTSVQDLDKPILAIARQMVTRIEQRIGCTLPADEVGFIYQYIVSSGIVVEERGDQVLLHNQFSTAESVKITCELIDRFSDFIQQDLAHDRLLFEGLLVHIKPLLNRLKYHIHIRNPLLDDIKQEMERIFFLAQQAMQQTAQTFALSPVADDEIGYLCVHFQAALERQIAHKRILVVCSSGVGTSHLLKSRILRAFPDWEIAGVVSASNQAAFCQHHRVDLVITTIHLDAGTIPAVYVSAFFNDDDIRRVTDAMIGSQLPNGAPCALTTH